MNNSNDGHIGLPKPGWYADPQSGERVRYWDGRSWTPHSRASAPEDPLTLEAPGDTGQDGHRSAQSDVQSDAPASRALNPTSPPTQTVPVASRSDRADHPEPPPAPATGGSDASAEGGSRRRFWRRVQIAAVGLVFLGAFSAGGTVGWWARGWLEPPTPVNVAVTVDRPITEPAFAGASGRMPSLIGLPEDQARQALLDADVEGTSISVSPVPAAGDPGLVVDQVPPAGAPISGPVVLGVSEAAEVPDVIGLGESAARDRFTQLGSRISVERIYREGSPEGTVLGTSPLPGELLPREVTLTVATAPSSIFLGQLPAVASDCRYREASVSGVAFSNAIVCRPYRDPQTSRVVEYDLGRRASQFEAVLGQADTGPTDRLVRVRILVDSNVVADEQVRFGQQHPISVSVRGVLRLRIEVSQVNEFTGYSDTQVVIGSPRLIGSPADIDELASGGP